MEHDTSGNSPQIRMRKQCTPDNNNNTFEIVYNFEQACRKSVDNIWIKQVVKPALITVGLRPVGLRKSLKRHLRCSVVELIIISKMTKTVTIPWDCNDDGNGASPPWNICCRRELACWRITVQLRAVERYWTTKTQYSVKAARKMLESSIVLLMMTVK